MGRTVYQAEDKAKALAVLKSCNGKVNQAARLLSIPRRTLAYWQTGAEGNGQGLKGVTPELVEEKRGALKQAFDTIAERITGVMGLKLNQLEQDEAALAKVSIKDLAIAGGISTEKALLLAGNPTRITETRSEAQRYEGAIKMLVDDCAGEIDRKEAIRLLSIHLPEINEYVN
jgi:regulatory Fis family protein